MKKVFCQSGENRACGFRMQKETLEIGRNFVRKEGEREREKEKKTLASLRVCPTSLSRFCMALYTCVCVSAFFLKM